jgi:hypothetical protein
MTVNENIEIEGALSKPFRLWHADGQSEFVALIVEADSLEEINRVRRRGDWRYQITRNGVRWTPTAIPSYNCRDRT